MSPATGAPAASPRTPFWAAFVAGVISFALLPPLVAIFSTVLAGLAIWIAAVDVDRLIIPDLAVVSMAVLGFALIAVETPPAALMDEIASGLLRALAAGGFLFLLRFAFHRIAGREGLGLGDVKLMAAGAIPLSWESLPYPLVLAAVAAIAVVLLRGIRQGAWLDRGTEIPFGAFLAPAIWVAFLLDRLYLL